MTELRCKSVSALLADHLDDGLSPEDNAAVKEHLRHCQRCQAELNELHQLGASVRSLTSHDPGPDFWKHFPQQVLNAYKRELRQQARATAFDRTMEKLATWPVAFVHPQIFVPIAAAVLLVSGAALWLVRNQAAEIGSYELQSGMHHERGLAELARENELPRTPGGLGFAESATSPNFFLAGTLYSQALAYAAGGDTKTARERTYRLKQALAPVTAAELAQSLAELPTDTAPTAAQLGALERALVSFAAASGSEARALFKGGAHLMDIRLAAAAGDRAALRLAAPALDRLRSDGRNRIAPGTLRALDALRLLLGQQDLAERDLRRLIELANEIQVAQS